MKPLRLPALLLALLAVPTAVSAQGRGSSLFSGPISVGPRVGRDFSNKAWSVGGQASALLGTNFELRPSGDVFFRRGERWSWQLNGDAALRFGNAGGLYGGGGIALVGQDDADTETGYNLFFGLSTAEP